MSRRLLMSVATVALLALTGPALLLGQGKAPAARQTFHISAGHATVDINMTPIALVYEKNVKFTSPVNETVITCQRLETNSTTESKVTAIVAKGDVTFSMLIEGKEKGKPAYKITGTAQLMTYSMNGARKIRLEKDKNVRPSLIITDLNSKEKTDLTGSGDIIEYNLDTRKLEMQNVEMDHEGSAE